MTLRSELRQILAVLFAACLTAMQSASHAAVIPKEFPQKDDSWVEPAPAIVSRGQIGDYPLFASMLQLEGYVTVIFWIDTKGAVKRPLLSEAQPAGLFEASCLDYVRTFKFKPQLRKEDEDPTTRRWSYTCRYVLQ